MRARSRGRNTSGDTAFSGSKGPKSVGVTSSTVDFVLDQLAELPDVRTLRMFGGFGVYSADRFFAIVFEGTVYFKVDDVNRAAYIKAGMKPFKPFAGRPTSLQYYEVPTAVIEDADELCRWARRAIAAAERNSKLKRTTR
jgi:DNA transformation protein